MKSVRALILCSSDSTFFHILRTMEKCTKYDFTLFGYGSKNEFVKKFHDIELIEKQPSEVDLGPFLHDICFKNNIDIILPSDAEYLTLLTRDLEQFRDIDTEPIIPVSDPSLLEILSCRPALFDYSSNVLSIPIPEYRIVREREMIEDSVHSLGYPQKSILFSSSHHTHERNIRFVDSSKDIRKLFFDEKPDAVFTTMHQFTHDVGDMFHEITAIKYDCVTEYSVEVLCRKGLTFATLVYSTNPLSHKMNTYSVLKKDQNFPIIDELVRKVVEGFGLSYSVGMRIWMDSEGSARLIDIIPHLRDSVILCLHAGVNLTELMIDMALREFDYNYKPTIKWGLQMQKVWLELLNYQGEVWKTEL